ncbi:hypothetical protein DFH08DRAFT_811601 [Mycena albidolilacea]|uniref:Uncharacterized protein n=1 Tax=Mycena albidolilacea TaxID=1033008 RepID=A0AAD6ZVN9_9AGAR|nr:hypothetical protein DFH08DRAFT_811601 [Mycena albidolilacea]
MTSKLESASTCEPSLLTRSEVSKMKITDGNASRLQPELDTKEVSEPIGSAPRTRSEILRLQRLGAETRKSVRYSGRVYIAVSTNTSDSRFGNKISGDSAIESWQCTRLDVWAIIAAQYLGYDIILSTVREVSCAHGKVNSPSKSSKTTGRSRGASRNSWLGGCYMQNPSGVEKAWGRQEGEVGNDRSRLSDSPNVRDERQVLQRPEAANCNLYRRRSGRTAGNNAI